MRRFLTSLLVFILIFANGAAVAGAICRHATLPDHIAARTSHISGIAVIALSEEAADSAATNKGALANAGAITWVADLSPVPQLTVPFSVIHTVDPEMAPVRPLVGRSLTPLLQPPSA